MDEELKEVIWVTKKRFLEAPNKNLSLETKNLVVDKDKDVVTKEDRSTKRILKTLLTQHIKEQQASHQNICTSMYV